MNQPKKETIVDWTNGELEGEALASVEAWATENPAMAESLANELEDPFTALTTLPKEVEPPYPDFLNAKIRQAAESTVAEGVAQEVLTPQPSITSKLQWLFVPFALAAMAACFVLGTQFAQKEKIGGGVAKKTESSENLVYVPSEKVSVRQFDSKVATVIVLDGLEPIADDDLAMTSGKEPSDSVRWVAKKTRETFWY